MDFISHFFTSGGLQIVFLASFVVLLIVFVIIAVIGIRRAIGGYTGRRICPDCGLELHSYKRNCPSCGRLFK